MGCLLWSVFQSNLFSRGHTIEHERLPILDQLEKWCKNLLYANEMGVIRFTHPSVREYVESEYSLIAAQACVAGLIKRAGCEEFASYARLYWPFHCGQAGMS